MFMGASLNPRYFKDKVNLFVAMGPAASLNHMANKVVLFLTSYWRIVKALANLLGFYQIIDLGWELESLGELLCKHELTRNLVCVPALAWLADSHPTETDNLPRLPVFMKDFPSGEGWLELVHFAQLIQEPGFVRFDYGKLGNMKHYLREEPPQVPLNRINIPVALVVGSDDLLANPTDAAWIAEQIDDSQLVFYEEY